METQYIKRSIEPLIKEAVEQFPVVALTGPRQTGKSTLLQNLFAQYNHISFDDIETRNTAKKDPSMFIASLKTPVIIDEVQYVPEILSYIKISVDNNKTKGQFILTGSQMFVLMTGLSETLAGRIALFELLPFSFEELGEKQKLPLDCYQQIIKGFYPFVNTNEVNIDRFYSSYLTTYIERDIRQIQNVKDLGLFQTFMQLLAARVGSLLNISELAKECAISNETAKNWLSILETSRIVYLLKPYFRNIAKRAVKSSKIYFTDCGLLAHLLKYKTADTLLASSISGHIFENMIIMEILKKNFNLQTGEELYFFRDNNKSEIDLIIDEGRSFSLFEIKAGKTIATDAVKNLQKIDLPNSKKFVLSFLENRLAINKDTLSIPWWECDKL